MLRKIVFSVLAMAIVMTIAGGAAAQPAEIQVTSVTPELIISGQDATCNAYIRSPGKTISATLELSCGGTVVASWQESGTSVVVISESATVTPGVTYTLTVSGTVNGVAFTPKSVTKTA